MLESDDRGPLPVVQWASVTTAKISSGLQEHAGKNSEFQLHHDNSSGLCTSCGNLQGNETVVIESSPKSQEKKPSTNAENQRLMYRLCSR